jgi:hypothetical protein
MDVVSQDSVVEVPLQALDAEAMFAVLYPVAQRSFLWVEANAALIRALLEHLQ